MLTSEGSGLENCRLDCGWEWAMREWWKCLCVSVYLFLSQTQNTGNGNSDVTAGHYIFIVVFHRFLALFFVCNNRKREKCLSIDISLYRLSRRCHKRTALFVYWIYFNIKYFSCHHVISIKFFTLLYFLVTNCFNPLPSLFSSVLSHQHLHTQPWTVFVRPVDFLLLTLAPTRCALKTTT